MDVEAIYRAFRDEPERNRFSYLHNFYKRGLAGIMRPDPTNIAASAAWRAGDEKRAKSKTVTES